MPTNIAETAVGMRWGAGHAVMDDSTVSPTCHVAPLSPSAVASSCVRRSASPRGPQGDRILIPSIDVDERLEGGRIIGPWVIDQGSTLLLLLEISDSTGFSGKNSSH